MAEKKKGIVSEKLVRASAGFDEGVKPQSGGKKRGERMSRSHQPVEDRQDL